MKSCSNGIKPLNRNSTRFGGRRWQRWATPVGQRLEIHLAVADRGGNWREFLLSLRWHLAGMSAVWLMIVLLNLNVGHSVSLASAVPVGKIPSAQIILASLRENRRELLETIQSSESREARPSKLFPIQPRSERFPETLTA